MSPRGGAEGGPAQAEPTAFLPAQQEPQGPEGLCGESACKWRPQGCPDAGRRPGSQLRPFLRGDCGEAGPCSDFSPLPSVSPVLSQERLWPRLGPEARCVARSRSELPICRAVRVEVWDSVCPRGLKASVQICPSLCQAATLSTPTTPSLSRAHPSSRGQKEWGGPPRGRGGLATLPSHHTPATGMQCQRCMKGSSSRSLAWGMGCHTHRRSADH